MRRFSSSIFNPHLNSARKKAKELLKEAKQKVGESILARHLNMRVFISHRFEGVNKKFLREKLESILSILENKGYETFVYFKDKENWKPKNFPSGKVIKKAFEEIKKSDILLVLIDSKKPSKGIHLEVGFAKALKKKIILLIHKKCPFPTLEALADKIIKFANFEDLKKRLNSNF